MATKINKTAYAKMALQAEEARDIGLKSLANNVFEALGSLPREEAMLYSWDDLGSDVQRALWKAASDVIAYHDLDSVDIQKIDDVVKHLSDRVIATIEQELNVLNSVGGLEPKVPGQK